MVGLSLRESFRPFAPAVMAERVENRFFEFKGESAYMLFVASVAEDARKTCSSNFSRRRDCTAPDG